MRQVQYCKLFLVCMEWGTKEMNSNMQHVEMGMRIWKMRKERRMTRDVLSEKADISPKFLYEIEVGKKGMSAETLLKIALALSVSCDYLLYGDEKSLSDRLSGLEPKQMERLERILELMREFCGENN